MVVDRLMLLTSLFSRFTAFMEEKVMINGFMFLVSNTNQIVHILLKLVYIEVFSFMGA